MADTPRARPAPPLRQQAEERRAWVEARLEGVLPALMERYDVDMWVLSMREYAEDPVFWSIVAPTTFAARRRSIYVFTRRPDGSVERLALGGGSQDGLYEVVRSARAAPGGGEAELWGGEQWALLHQVVADRDPGTIVLNIDPEHAFADGLHAGEREALERALGPYVERVRREPRLAIDYLAIRVPEMLPRYIEMQRTVHALIREAFSLRVIEPGVTTTDDVAWWLRERVRELGMAVWFHPSVGVQHPGDGLGWTEGVIGRGDALWVDFGIDLMGLKTDTQHLAYLPREGEERVPEGLERCLAASNRLQDIVLRHLEPGRTGNQILADVLAQMRAERIDGTVYTHPIGDHGHGAGPLIGRWDDQDGVPVRGDVVLRPSTWHSVELQATVPVPEWGGEPLSCRQEEEALVDAEGRARWIYRRQADWHLVR